MLYNKEQVLQFIPHRDPFLFIDSIESITHNEKRSLDGPLDSTKEVIGVEVVANFNARKDHVIFKGHFPGRPILPGVVQVEMMAQAAVFSITTLFESPFEVDLEVALMGVSDAKFRKPVLPGMDLVIHAICTKARGSIVSYECKVKSGETNISECTVLASVKY